MTQKPGAPHRSEAARRIIVLLALVATTLGLGLDSWRSGGLSKLRVVIEETKYEGAVPRLRNDGLLPALVERCTYTTDTNKPGVTVQGTSFASEGIQVK